MSTLKLELGFTDSLNADSMRIDDTAEKIEHETSYNLWKQDPSIEKATFTWKIRTDINAVLRTLDVSEDIIRKPHLKMIILQTPPNPFVPDYMSYRLAIQFLSLLPLKDTYTPATVTDFESAEIGQGFGTMYINIHDMFAQSGVLISETIYGSYLERKIDNIVSDAVPMCVPHFSLSMDLRPQTGSAEAAEKYERSQFNQWLEKNKEELENAGADLNKTPFAGMIPFAELQDDPWEVYQSLIENPYLCRWSIIKED